MQQASLYARTQAAAQAVEGAREVVFSHPPSSPFVMLATFDADQLLLPWPTVWVIFAVYGFRLGSELTRANTLVAIFVTRQRSPTAATLNLSSGTSSESVPRLQHRNIVSPVSVR